MGINGIVLIDKEPEKTSFEVVQDVKRSLEVKKAGHSGTLDKFATGLLIICINKATSFQKIFMTNKKVYRAKIRLGKQTETLDPYGKVIDEKPYRQLKENEVEDVLKKFIGEIEQYPPLFSAIHINGKRLYKRVLNGEVINIRPRKVQIHSIKLLNLQGDSISIEATVSKGTYIRSLARDIAKALGTVGYCESLKRLSIGPFNIDEAVKVKDVTEDRIIPIESALEYLESINVDKSTAEKVDRGFPAYRLFKNELIGLKGKYIKIIYNQKLIAVLEKNDKLNYFKVLGLHRSDYL